MSIGATRDGSFGWRSALLSPRFAVVWAVVTASYVYGWATRWTFDPRTTSTILRNTFFTEQANSILSGHLWIDPQSHPWECFFVDDKCYGYFGIVPSLFRVPLLGLFGSGIGELAALFIALAVGIAVWAGVDLCRRVLRVAGGERSPWAPWSMASAAMVIGPAGLLVVLIDPYVYHESLAWSVAGTLVASNYVFRWWHARSRHLLVVATVAVVVASGARPTAAFAGTVVTVGLWFLTRREGRPDRKTLVAMVALAIVPIVATFGVMMLKFGSPLPPYESYQSKSTPDFQYLETINPGLKNGPGNAPTSLLAYVRPDAIRFKSSPPFVTFRFGNPRWGPLYERITYLPPLPKDYLYVERSSSVSVLTPLGTAAIFGAFGIALRRPRQRFPLVLLASVAVQPAAMLMTYAISLRYVVDFYPLLAVSVAFLVPIGARLGSLTRQARWAVVCALGVMTLWSLWVIPALAARDARIYIHGIGAG